MTPIDQQCIDAIRFLSIDAVQKANSGHPGMPLGAAPMAYTLWDRHLRHNPQNPDWFDRDRFILSAGHASMLVYSLLHLYGYDLPVEEIENFRQWGSRTAGHPEYGLTPGVECTTGPLGQGFAMGVGMAMAEAHLRAAFGGVDGTPLVDHYTYAIVSDGDVMEGVSNEAASLAGHLGLGRLVYLYDDNGITIEGGTDLAFTENVDGRFEAFGWHVQVVEDGNDIDAINGAIEAAKAETSRPSLIRVSTHIGFGSPRVDSAKAHGEPLGADNVAATREALGWEHGPFVVPDAVREHCRGAVAAGANAETAWNARLDAFRQEQPERAAMLETLMRGELPDDWDTDIPSFDAGDKPIATRSASGKVLGALAGRIPTLIGGSADLGGSNKSEMEGAGDFLADSPEGRNIHFGVREHAMGAIVNGMALHGGVFPYGATFLIFSDYMRPALRLSALMNVPSMFIFTHDSIGLGEDGPTHQPVEQLMSLRAIPRLATFRPADANETAASWRAALQRRGPSAFALSRQNLPVLGDIQAIESGVPRGAYVVSEAEGDMDVVLLGTGSEVHLAIAAQAALRERGVGARVVSMPSWELWHEQDADYRASVLPPGVPVLAVEAGAAMGWREVVGDTGAVIGLDRFGESAPGEVVIDKLGFNVDNVVAHAIELAGRKRLSLDSHPAAG
jgi:transketolase